MWKLSIILAVLLLMVVGCMDDGTFPPIEPTPTAIPASQVIYNQNPYLPFGDCNYNQWFDIPGDGFGKRYYNQCWPSGHELYVNSCNETEMDIRYTGKCWNFHYGGRCGDAGYEFDAAIPATCAVIEVEGFYSLADDYGNHSMRATIGIAGTQGKKALHQAGWQGDGDFLAQFYVDVTTIDTYTIQVYFHRPFVLGNTEGYALIYSIKIYPVSQGHCEGKPSI